MTSSPPARGIRLLLTTFRDRGWRDEANAALSIMESIVADTHVLDSPGALEVTIPDEFLLVNNVTAADVYAAIHGVAGSLRDLGAEARALERPPILQIGDIDSFREVRKVPAAEVAHFANPLDLPEDTVEKIIAK